MEIVSPSQENLSQDYSWFSRTLEHPLTQNFVNSAKGYYNSAKEFNPVVKYGCERFESNLSYSAQWIAPRLKPVLENENVKKYSETFDEIGSTTLDRVTLASSRVNETWNNSKKNLDQVRVGAWKKAEESLHQMEESMRPIDNYLNESLIGKPLNVTLDITENVCQRFIFNESSEEGEEEEKSLVSSQGPLLRSKNLSKKLQKEAFSKMKNLSLRSTERIQSMKHCVNLIQYAKDHLDSSVKATSELIENSYHKTLEMSHNGVNYVQEKRKNLEPHLKELKSKIESNTNQAITALSNVIDQLSKKPSMVLFQEKSRHLIQVISSQQLSDVSSRCLSAVESAREDMTRYLTSEESPQLLRNVVEHLESALEQLAEYTGFKKKQLKIEQKDHSEE